MTLGIEWPSPGAVCYTIAEASTNYGGAKKSNPTLGFGRSPPSRQMVLRLGEAVGVSLRERNQLPVAAGLPPAYPEAPVAGAELAPYQAAIDLSAERPPPVSGHGRVVPHLRPRRSSTGPRSPGLG